ncbi:cip1-interacting zinc finger protein [Ischnura elegans]|uniref:cip1-interacting zinc finger protein n=1 Tax=Ischnura elegans TaxID=197161 RepID=UPI001ED89182|nr:cip1-interacting zinc finger protein [Ischnura elegans]
METKQQMAAEAAGVSVIQLPHPDSLSTASVKEYAPSFSSEPPPAYQRPRSTAVQVARIAGVTLVAASAILGAFLLAAAWISAKHSCAHHVVVPMQASHSQGHEHLPSFDRLVDPLQASEQKLEATKLEHVANAIGDGANTKDEEAAKKEDPAEVKETNKGEEEEGVSEEEEDEDEDGSEGNSEENPIQIRVPLQLDFDEIAGMLMERNLRSRMNCVVEKRKAEEVVEHHPRTLQLPFGLNLTTDPRHERVTGERMAIFCESGHDQMQQQQRRPEMPFEFIPLMAPQQQQQPMQQMQPEPMIVPLPGPIHLPFHFMGPMHHQQQAQSQQPLPMHPQAPHLEEPHMQGPMPQPQQQTIHIFTPVHQQGVPQSEAQHHQEMLRRQMLEQEQALENMRPPPPPVPSAHQLPPHQQAPPVHHMPQMGPLPGHQGPIISVHHLLALAEGASDEDDNQEQAVPSGRAFREQIPQRLPVHIPMQGNNIRGPSIPMPEEHRPHYVQPRSVPSDPFTGELHRREKRVKKRCACDCSC